MVRATLSPDGVHVALQGNLWRQRFAVEDLPRWLGLYRRLRDNRAPRDKKGNLTGQGPNHDVYAPAVRDMEQIARDLRAKERTKA